MKLTQTQRAKYLPAHRFSAQAAMNLPNVNTEKDRAENAY
jgi:hypothetical protein